MNQKVAQIGTSVLALLLLSQSALACPAYLTRLNSPTLADALGESPIQNLCNLYDQYHALTDAASSLSLLTGGEPERIRYVFGPRFINFPDFNSTQSQSLDYDPWLIYDPSPGTWQDWENAQAIVKDLSQTNFTHALQEQGPGGLMPLQNDMLLRIHTASLIGLPRFESTFRVDEHVIGAAFHRSQAMPAHAANRALFPLDAQSQPMRTTRRMDTWHPTRCYEDMGSAERAAVDSGRVSEISAHPGYTFTGTREGRDILLQCGYLEYPAPNQISAELKQWMADVNSTITTWFSDHPTGDPVLVASRAQRWFVSIHPFTGGNGRTSRFMMDYILTSLGLPAPVLSDMNMDLASTEQEWAARVASGLKQTVYLLDLCKRALAEDPKAPICQVTTHQPDRQ